MEKVKIVILEVELKKGWVQEGSEALGLGLDLYVFLWTEHSAFAPYEIEMLACKDG